MSHWNYRVMNRNGALAVYSVSYDDDGEVENWSQDPVAVTGPAIEDLQVTVELFAEAFKKPVLDHDGHPIVEALLQLVLGGTDLDAARAEVLRLARDSDAAVRGIAVLCVGHIARLHRAFDDALRAVLVAGYRDADKWVVEHTISACRDVDHFVGVRLEPWDR